MTRYQIRRLGTDDLDIARCLFSMMADVFDEDSGELAAEPLTAKYLGQILNEASFWALAAFDADLAIGGLTAHTLPMTRSACAELFIYDLAVRCDYRRQGVATELIRALRASAADEGIDVVFVPADNEDRHALDFYLAQGATAAPVTHFTFGPA